MGAESRKVGSGVTIIRSVRRLVELVVLELLGMYLLLVTVQALGILSSCPI
jgi:hypothetical protein